MLAMGLGSIHGQQLLYSFPPENFLGGTLTGAPVFPRGGVTSLMLAGDGNFYGTTSGDGRSTHGTVFRFSHAGDLTTLALFSNTNGSLPPLGGLTQGTNGDFYGSTYFGGNLALNNGSGFGTLYEMTPTGTLRTLVVFNNTNGANPYGALVQAADGNLYGTTMVGGNLSLNNGAGVGTFFKLRPDGTITTLMNFSSSGGYPSGVIQGSDGNFYGTTYWGGGNNLGTVFKTTSTGGFITLVTFSGSNGAHPAAGLIQAADGNLYGTTYWGGNLSLNNGNGYGSVFRISTNGTGFASFPFHGDNGAHPWGGIMQASDGNFYGTTFWGGDLPLDNARWNGTAFLMTPAGTFNTLVSFTGANGAFPFAGLRQGTNGNLYGTTSMAGPDGGGTIFRLDLSPPLTLLQQPEDQFVMAAADARFHAVASGTAPLAYQWWFNGSLLTNAIGRNLTLTNVQITNAGTYAVTITNTWGAVTSCLATLQVDPLLVPVTTGPIVASPGTGSACAWGDYDNDGFLDLIVSSAMNVNTRLGQPNRLFHNNRDGTFTAVTSTAVTSESRDWRGCTWIDYDNDGLLDLYIVSTDINGLSPANELFRNNGDGTFIKLSSNDVGLIVTNAAGGSEGPTWADFDQDGFVDLYVARYGPDWMFHNHGDATFAQLSLDPLGLGANTQDSYDAAWADFNNDGLPDLFVAVKSDPPTNRLYLNLGGGSFALVTNGPVASDYAHSFSPVWADYDNDGNLDLFVSNGSYVFPETCFFYRNNGDGTFTRLTSAQVGSLASDIGQFGGCAWGDYDNDGFQDLFLLNWGGRNSLYHNNGDGSFTRIFTGSLAAGSNMNPISCAWGDYDNDGFLDLVVARGADDSLERNLLYHNTGNSNAWVRIKLVGTVSNRSAIGAKVRAKATIRGRALWQMREISTGDGWNEGPLEAHFGLGDATNLDTLRIEWPSGTVQEFHNLAPRQILSFTEPPRLQAGTSNGIPQFVLHGGRFMQYEIQASTDLAAWSPIGTVVITNLSGTAVLVDTNTPALDHQFYRAVSH